VSAAIAHSLAVADSQVTLPQLRILVMVNDSGPLNMSAVADGLGVNPSNASRTCQRLVRADLLDRRDDPDDRRNVLLTLTPGGRRLVTSMMHQRRLIFRRVLTHLSPAERDRLTSALQAFNRAASVASEDGQGFPDGDGDLLRWLS
jgi:DNA-binding MarR family transcriptional regulator